MIEKEKFKLKVERRKFERMKVIENNKMEKCYKEIKQSLLATAKRDEERRNILEEERKQIEVEKKKIEEEKKKLEIEKKKSEFERKRLEDDRKSFEEKNRKSIKELPSIFFFFHFFFVSKKTF